MMVACVLARAGLKDSAKAVARRSLASSEVDPTRFLYMKQAFAFVTGVGGSLVWQGAPKAVLLGPSQERWDLALLVRYPSKEAFLAMVSDPAYQAVTVHRTAALEDSRLIATLPATP